MRFLIVLLFTVACLRADLYTAAGSFTTPAATGTFTPVTGLSFQPKVVIFLYSLATTDNIIMDGMNIGMGFGVSSALTAATFIRTTNGSQNVDSATRNTRAYAVLSSALGDLNTGYIYSMNSDGFTMYCTNATQSGHYVRWLAIGGSDITGAYVERYTSPTATGSQSLTGVGFAPDFILIATIGSSSTNFSGTSRISIGVAERTGNSQAVHGMYIAQASTGRRTVYSRSKVIQAPELSTMKLEAGVSSWDSDGVTLNWTAVDTSAGNNFYVLYLKGGKYKIMNHTQPASTGTQAVSGAGFQPKGLFSFSGCVASEGFSTGAWSLWGVGSSSAYGHVAGVQADDSLRSRDTSYSSYFLGCYTPSGTSTNIDSRATLASLDSDGFTLSWTTANSPQRLFTTVAFGPSASAGGPARRRVYVTGE